MDSYPDVVVEWDDAWVEGTEFVTMDGIIDSHLPWLVRTKGWLLLEDDKGISLANEMVVVDGRERFRGRTFIPRAMIRRVIRKAVRKKRQKQGEIEVK